MPRHERTLQMMENFIPLHNEGHSIEEIANMFDLSTTTVYNYLDEIAEKAGVTRDSLLEKVIIADHSGRNFTPVKPIDEKQFKEKFASVRAGIESLQDEILRTIEEMETMNELLEEELNGRA